MRKGNIAINKLVLFLIVLFVLLVLIALIFRIEGFKEIFITLLESFK